MRLWFVSVLFVILNRLGNNGADEAADFGRGRVPWWIIDARRNYSGVCARWRPLVLVLHRFFLAIARAVVNHDGVAGLALDPMVWSVGGAPKRCRVVYAVRDRTFLPGCWDLGWGVGRCCCDSYYLSRCRVMAVFCKYAL